MKLNQKTMIENVGAGSRDDVLLSGGPVTPIREIRHCLQRGKMGCATGGERRDVIPGNRTRYKTSQRCTLYKVAEAIRRKTGFGKKEVVIQIAERKKE